MPGPAPSHSTHLEHPAGGEGAALGRRPCADGQRGPPQRPWQPSCPTEPLPEACGHQTEAWSSGTGYHPQGIPHQLCALSARQSHSLLLLPKPHAALAPPHVHHGTRAHRGCVVGPSLTGTGQTPWHPEAQPPPGTTGTAPTLVPPQHSRQSRHGLHLHLQTH